MKNRDEAVFKKPLSILLADDDADDRELFEEAVSVIDPAIVITAMQDGEELMNSLRHLHPLPDMIFLDLNMPKKNGKECLCEIRGSVAIKDIPVVIYTTSLNPVDIEDTYNHGAFLFFRKPTSFEELKNMLHQIFNNSTELAARRTKEKFIFNGNIQELLEG